MRSSNPVLTTLPKASQEAGYGYSAPEAFENQQAAPERPMTIDDVVTKTGISLAVIIIAAVASFFLTMSNPGLGMLLTIVGAIGGFITVMISSFGNKAGAGLTITYAIFEGLFVGGLSNAFASTTTNAIIGQAVLATVGVFIGMLFVYKTGAIRVTPKFNRVLTGMIIGVLVAGIGNLILWAFTGNNPLTDGGPLAIIFSLVSIVLAALSFLQDFDLADEMVRRGAPSKMAWGVALGLCVTLVWLYTEILRLLSYFED